MAKKPEAPPVKICDVNLKSLALDYKDTTKTLKEIIEDPVKAATVTTDAQIDMIVPVLGDEDFILPYDDNEGYDSRLEMLTDTVTKEFVKKGKPSESVPEIVFTIPCIDPVTPTTLSLMTSKEATLLSGALPW